MKTRITHLFLSALLLPALALTLITGCAAKQDNSLSPTEAVDAAAVQDAAESVADAVALNNGGAMEQLNDMLLTASIAGIPGNSTAPDGEGDNSIRSISKIYDSTTGWWTVSITREHGSSSGLYYAYYSRVYKHQFLNKDGQFQKFYITNTNGIADTAYSIQHVIVSGTGTARTPKHTHHILSLAGKWLTTNANQPSVTINSIADQPYSRSASDTVTTVNSLRTLNNSLTLSFANIIGPRGSGLNWHLKTSGTITGHYHADLTSLKGETYKEKTIDRDISITIGGAKIKLNFGGKGYDVDPATGIIY